jgi:hypothetical protein
MDLAYFREFKLLATALALVSFPSQEVVYPPYCSYEFENSKVEMACCISTFTVYLMKIGLLAQELKHTVHLKIFYTFQTSFHIFTSFPPRNKVDSGQDLFLS